MTVIPQTLEPHTNKPVGIRVPSNMQGLEARGICVSLGKKKIIRDIDISARPNEILAIIGPSGCGKSTFISTLNQMIKHTLPAAHVEGDVLLNGQSDINPIELRRKIAMVFQRPNPFPFSIRKNMEFALKANGDRNKQGYEDKIEHALRQVNLWDSLKNRLNDGATCLSGGEQQRLCISRALLAKPEVFLFDEPCSALDPISCTAIEELVVDLKKDCSIVIVTHNLAQARRISDRCSLFWPIKGCGQVIETDTTSKILVEPERDITRAYINGEFC